MSGPNSKQRDLIEGTTGCYLVDAGPGTGKTYTITRRYAEIVEQDGVDPSDVLLITFTRNAATEMRDRITTHCDYGPRELRDAPIQTFHSLCSDLLRDHGFDAPNHLGIDESITQSMGVIEDESIERTYFREFIDRFTDDHPDHHDVIRAISNPTTVKAIIETLAAKGVFPTTDGWYRDCADLLYGDEDAFRSAFDQRNRPRNDGNKQSRLRQTLGRYGRDSCYLPDAPARSEIRGERGSKSIPDHVASLAFDEDREDLLAFVHDVYIEYIEFALSRNYLTFGFLQLFAFVCCCENDQLRDRLAFEYVMIDEFQDTSEIQFKLALLLADTDNLCVVGDWKQSIYAFQYADVANITHFRDRLDRFVTDLNADRQRIDITFEPIQPIELERNYRSTQSIVDLAETALVAPGSSTESLDEEAIRQRVVSLSAETDRDHSQIEAITHADEHAAILETIDDIVGNEDYAVRDPDLDPTAEAVIEQSEAGTGDNSATESTTDAAPLRRPTYSDIAVFTRTREFGRELLSVAEEYEYPMAYEGGVELFRSDPAKSLLAWLRILEDGADADRGWAVVLERAGYTIEEIRHVLDTERYPTEFVTFRDSLDSLESVGAISHRVCTRYGATGPTAAVLRSTIQSVQDATTMTRGALIRFIERGIESGTTHEVSAAAGTDAVRVQTIHAAKGLEYPIVILANVNRGSFPPGGGDRGTIVYDERFGLRQRSIYAEAHGQPHCYDNWRWDVLQCCRPRNYDEERRLLYVAMTRARDHLVCTAGERPSPFFEALPIESTTIEPDLSPIEVDESVQTTFSVRIPEPAGPAGFSPHDLMDERLFENVDAGHGSAFGQRIHDFAERYALDGRNGLERRSALERGDDGGSKDGVVGESTDKPPTAQSNDDTGVDKSRDTPPDETERRHRAHVTSFIDGCSGTLRVEEDAYLPLDVDGERVSLHGVIDLLHVTDDAVEIVDYKTDIGRHAEDAYRTQLSVYYHVVRAAYPDRSVSASILYTDTGDREPIEPRSQSELASIVGAVMEDDG